MRDSESILFFVLLGLVLVFGPSVLGVLTFLRVRQLRADVEVLSARLYRLETRPAEPGGVRLPPSREAFRRTRRPGGA